MFFSFLRKTFQEQKLVKSFLEKFKNSFYAFVWDMFIFEITVSLFRHDYRLAFLTKTGEALISDFPFWRILVNPFPETLNRG